MHLQSFWKKNFVSLNSMFQWKFQLFIFFKVKLFRVFHFFCCKKVAPRHSGKWHLAVKRWHLCKAQDSCDLTVMLSVAVPSVVAPQKVLLLSTFLKKSFVNYGSNVTKLFWVMSVSVCHCQAFFWPFVVLVKMVTCSTVSPGDCIINLWRS